ncbi:hypothetical protein V490_04089 [Pseudogymnoascus sp. VKM F-3557]|nr:hypothetical protein V490_04089 [Pseudogymnoascus sp. VKM F-3557]
MIKLNFIEVASHSVGFSGDSTCRAVSLHCDDNYKFARHQSLFKGVSLSDLDIVLGAIVSSINEIIVTLINL